MTHPANYIGANSNKNRSKEDFYPTPPEATFPMMQKAIEDGFLCKNDQIWEPACGDGSIAKVIEYFGYKVTGTE